MYPLQSVTSPLRAFPRALTFLVILAGLHASTAVAAPSACTIGGPAVKLRAGETRELLISCTTGSGQPVAVEIVTPFTDLTATYKGERSSSSVYDVTAAADYTGTDAITVQGRDADGPGGLTERKTTVREASANEAPVCWVRTPALVTVTSVPVVGTIVCSDPDLDAYGVELAGVPGHGVAEVLPVTHWLVDHQPFAVRYTSAVAFIGPDTVSVRARDDHGGVSPVYAISVNVRGVDAPSGPPDPEDDKDPAAERPTPRVTLGKLPRLGTALRRGMRLKVRADRDGTLRLRVRVDGRTAKRLKLSRKGRTTTIASATRKITAGQTRTTTVRFTARARRALRRVKRLRVTVTSRVGAGTTVTRKATLCR